MIVCSCCTMAETQLLFQCLLPFKIFISTSVVFSASCKRLQHLSFLFKLCYEAEDTFGSIDQKTVEGCVRKHDFIIENVSLN